MIFLGLYDCRDLNLGWVDFKSDVFFNMVGYFCI